MTELDTALANLPIGQEYRHQHDFGARTGDVDYVHVFSKRYKHRCSHTIVRRVWDGDRVVKEIEHPQTDLVIEVDNI